MIEFNGMKIFFYAKEIDMRKGIDGLCCLLVEQDTKPQSGDLYLFSNRSGKTLKGLIWDRNGFILIYKRLENGRLKIKYDARKNGQFELTATQLRWLLAGLDFEKIILFPELNLDDFY